MPIIVLSEQRHEGRPVVPALEIGCGRRRDPRCDKFMDANPEIPGLDHCGDALGPFPWPDGTFDLIIATDVAEHVSYRDTGRMFAEWARVLAPGGRLFVQVPDAELIMRRFIAGDERLVAGLPSELPQTVLAGATWRLLGGHADGSFVADGDDWRWNAHYALFSEASLTEAIQAAGLSVVECRVNGHPNIQLWAVKP